LNAPLIECVPNFSEGRDTDKVRAIQGRIAEAEGVLLLDKHIDPDHNRSVITFAGLPDAVADAAVTAAGVAMDLIDIRRHRGVHPRIGAIDVLPFVPLRGVDLRYCAELARDVARRIWKTHGLPAYLYEAAAVRMDRVNLADVRRQALSAGPDSTPDVGSLAKHPTGGAVAVGARKLLIAFNVQLATDDVTVATRIARAVRASSGGLPAVKAIGLMLASRGHTQVSMNLTDFEITAPRRALDAVEREAVRLGVAVIGSELVGLIPARALGASGGRDLKIEGFHPGMILENRLAEVARSRRDTIG